MLGHYCPPCCTALLRHGERRTAASAYCAMPLLLSVEGGVPVSRMDGLDLQIPELAHIHLLQS